MHLYCVFGLTSMTVSIGDLPIATKFWAKVDPICLIVDRVFVCVVVGTRGAFIIRFALIRCVASVGSTTGGLKGNALFLQRAHGFGLLGDTERQRGDAENLRPAPLAISTPVLLYGRVDFL